MSIRSTHKSKDGIQLIAQMSSTHLANTILMHLRNVDALNRMVAQSNETDEFTRMTYGVGAVSKETIAARVGYTIDTLTPYLAEAFIRGMTDLIEKVQDTLNRKDALPGGVSSKGFALGSGGNKFGDGPQADFDDPNDADFDDGDDYVDHDDHGPCFGPDDAWAWYK